MERKIYGISKFLAKKDNLERLTDIFEMNFRKFSVPFDFEPEFSEILVEWNASKLFSMLSVHNYIHWTRTTKNSEDLCILRNSCETVFSFSSFLDMQGYS